MKNDPVFNQLSSYLDNQLSADERRLIEEHLKQCKDCQEELRKLKLISEKLKIWQEPELGPFFEKSVMDKISSQEQRKGEVKMKSKTTRDRVAIGILTTIIIGCLVSMQTYAKRALQGRIKGAADYLVTNTPGLGNEVQYEPYYLSSTGEVKRASSSIDKISIESIRKLIKKAKMTLEVKNCEDTAKRIADIAVHYEGYVLSSDIKSYQGGSKRGTTIFKVLPKFLENALADLKTLGRVDSLEVKGEDVTEEYVDLKARLDNAEAVRQRMLKVLDEKAKDVKDILQVEKELARIGEEIEKIKGRMKYIDTQVDLSTVTVDYYETQSMTLSPIKAGEKFKQTIRTAAETFVNVFNGIIVLVSGLLPILLWGGVIAGVILGINKLNKK
ncbi:MAG: DUF4349 domain-containing protein [Candidatus Omnitrophota bacterium]